MADPTSIYVLNDTADKLIIELTRQQTDATQETHVEKINSAALFGATFNMATAGGGVAPNGLVAGETITGQSSNATARVVRWQPEANNIYINNVNGSFTNGEVVVGSITHTPVQLSGSANALTSPARVLDIESLWFTIPDNASVTLEWEGTLLQNANTANTNAFFQNIVTLFNNHYFGRNALTALYKQPFSNLAVNSTFTFTANGSMALTTLGMAANGGYSVVLELRKGNGYAPIPDERSGVGS